MEYFAMLCGIDGIPIYTRLTRDDAWHLRVGIHTEGKTAFGQRSRANGWRRSVIPKWS